jgi:hypothetical protein
MKNGSFTCRSRVYLSQGLIDFPDFLSLLQDHRNRLLLESIVVLSLESHVGSFDRCFRRSIPSAVKNRQRTPLVRIASRPGFGLH